MYNIIMLQSFDNTLILMRDRIVSMYHLFLLCMLIRPSTCIQAINHTINFHNLYTYIIMYI